MRKRLLYVLVLIVLASLFCFSFTACKDDENPDNGKSCSHTYSDTYTCHDRSCTLCGKVVAATTNHDFTYGDCPCGELNTCQHNFNTPHTCFDRTCTECGSIILATTKHNYVDYECTVCNTIRPSDGLTYKLSDNGSYYIVTGIGTFTGDKLSIPEQYNAIPVKEIGDNAFKNNTELKIISISDNVINIGEYAFAGCVAEIKWGDNPTITTIGRYAFYGYNGTNITMPNSVTWIAGSAFSNCSRLIEVTIPNSVTIIGDNAFYNCSSLTEVIIPNSVTSIGDSIFSHCNSLTSAIIGDNLTSISENMFYNCSSLSEVTISKIVKNIWEDAFYGCSGLKKVNYTGTIDDWAQIEFDLTYSYPNLYYCYSNPLYYANNLYINEILVTNAVITTAKIANCAFYNCTSLTSVTIGDSVKIIGGDAFYRCDKLVEVYNLSSLSITAGSTNYGSIGRYAKSIHNDRVATSILETDVEGFVTINNNGVKTLVSYVGNQSKITIPSDIKAIYKCAFSNNNIKSIIIPNTVTNIDWYAFSGCSAEIIWENPVITSINSWIFDGYKGTSITIPKSVRTISFGAFTNCNSLTSIIVDENNEYYKSINGNLYSKDGKTLIQYAMGKRDTSFTIPNSVTSIGDNAFYNCSSLTNITISNSVTSIGSDAFYDCVNLSNITIGNNVTNIDERSFANCTNLKEIVIPNSVISIGDTAFGFCSALTKVTIGNGVTTIGDTAFGWCTGLKEIIIGNSVTSIGYNAFYGCSRLTNAIFLDTDGWRCEISTSGIFMSSTNLANTSTAATYLRSTYVNYDWYKD